MGLLSFLSMIFLFPDEPQRSTEPEVQNYPQNYPSPNTVPSRPETDMPAYQYPNSWNDQSYGYRQQQHPQHYFVQQPVQFVPPTNVPKQPVPSTCNECPKLLSRIQHLENWIEKIERDNRELSKQLIEAETAAEQLRDESIQQSRQIPKAVPQDMDNEMLPSALKTLSDPVSTAYPDVSDFGFGVHPVETPFTNQEPEKSIGDINPSCFTWTPPAPVIVNNPHRIEKTTSGGICRSLRRFEYPICSSAAIPEDMKIDPRSWHDNFVNQQQNVALGWK